MKHRTYALIAVAIAAMAAPAAAQNRAEQQITLDIRVLQAQVQQLMLAVNTLGEKVKNTDARIETLAGAQVKSFADQKLQIDAVAGQQRTLNASEGDSAVRVLQLTQEVKVIREGLDRQMTALNEILVQFQQSAATAAAATTPPDPDAPPTVPPPPRPGASLPASPSAIYKNAMYYFYQSQFDNAVDALTDAIKRYPESPEAALAQYTIGESYDAMGGHSQEALAAYALVIKNYKDPTVVPDAYYSQGQVQEKLGQKDAAIASYREVKRLFPNSTTAALADTALKRIIK